MTPEQRTEVFARCVKAARVNDVQATAEAMTALIEANDDLRGALEEAVFNWAACERALGNEDEEAELRIADLRKRFGLEAP